MPKRAEKSQQYYVQVMNWATTYHNHKEIMAHGILLVNFGVSYSVISRNWPNPKLYNMVDPTIISVTTVLVALFLHCSMCSQIFNKRGASLIFGASMIVLRDMRLAPIYLQYGNEQNKEYNPVRVFFCNYFFPLGCLNVIGYQFRDILPKGKTSTDTLNEAIIRDQGGANFDAFMVFMSLGAVAVTIYLLPGF